ncbi:MAG: ABC transporter ATP-binding protein/permease [Gammaproteobacteria bacterium]|nr:ABC transporter ATP-binding protein/permease [Gammaproteobacteria bacterium]
MPLHTAVPFRTRNRLYQHYTLMASIRPGEKDKYTDRYVLGRFSGYLSQFKWWIVISIVLMTTAASFQALFVFLIEDIINNFSEIDPVASGQNRLLLILLAGFFVSAICATLGTYLVTRIGQTIIADQRQRTFHTIVSLPYSRYEKLSIGELVNRMLVQINSIATLATGVIISFAQDIFLVASLVAVMVYHSPSLSLVTFATLVLLYLVFRIVHKYYRELSKSNIYVYDGMTKLVMETINDFLLIRLYANKQESPKSKDFEIANRKIVYVLSRTEMMRQMFQLMTQFLVFSILLLIIFLASNKIMVESIDAGVFVSFLFSFLLMAQPIRRLTTSLVHHLPQSIVTCREMFIIQDWETEDLTGADLNPSAGKITLQNIDYTYAGKEHRSLDDVSFTIPGGKTTAIIGPSGSGKSTVVKLLLRMYLPDRGRIIIDDQDIAECSGRQLRNHISMLTQEPIICNGTVADNIAYGDLSHHSEAEIRTAAESAYALDFIEQLPKKFNTRIGSDTSTMLSGGQCQRIALARVFLKNSNILIFDEPTSSLDPHSEELIYRAIEKLRPGRTIIIIAHRRSTLRSADHLIALAGGRVEYSGSVLEAQPLIGRHFLDELDP